MFNQEFICASAGAFDIKKLKSRVECKVNAGGSSADMYLFGYIHPYLSFSAANIKPYLDDFKSKGVKNLNVALNTGGGQVFEGNLIWNLFQDFKETGATVDVEVVGLAASMGSKLMFMGSDKPRIADSSHVMIHQPRGTFEDVTAKQLQAKVKMLEGIQNEMVDLYANRTGQKKDQIVSWMDDETWFTAKEALAEGFASKITKTAVTENCIDEQVAAALNFKHPEKVKHFFITNKTENPMPVEPTNADPGKDNSADIEKIKNENAETKKQLIEMKAEALVNAHAARLKLTVEAKANYQKLAVADYDTTKKTLEAMQPVAAISQQINAGASPEAKAADRSKWTFADWAQKDSKALVEMRDKERDKYTALYKEQYKSEPTF